MKLNSVEIVWVIFVILDMLLAFFMLITQKGKRAGWFSAMMGWLTVLVCFMAYRF